MEYIIQEVAGNFEIENIYEKVLSIFEKTEGKDDDWPLQAKGVRII